MKVFRYPEEESLILKMWQALEGRDSRVENEVKKIIKAVRERGEQALVDLTQRIDGIKIEKRDLRIPKKRLEEAWNKIPVKLKDALKIAERNIKGFHKRQIRKGWTLARKNGVRLSQRIKPLERVGIYIPGGRAPYPSSVLMNVIPAKVAGVREIVLATPPKEGGFNEAILAAAWLVGIEEAYWIGGAQAVAAMAYGTETIKPVDKVIGPGNIYVTTAKRLLYGTIDIDSTAGPSEILIVADKTASLEFIAADLISQAEHDVDAIANIILIEPFPVENLLKEIKRQAKIQPRYEVIKKSLSKNGMTIIVQSREGAVYLANKKAPEHLEIMTERPRELADKIRNVGATFIGQLTPVPMGDYVAGPNHVLPTGGTARFFSPLSVDDFLKVSNCIEYSQRGLLEDGESAIVLGEAEGFFAHSESVRKRIEFLKKRRISK